MFYVFWVGWVNLEKTAKIKTFSANATQKAKKSEKGGIYPFSVEH
jgi:hypothetical protein